MHDNFFTVCVSKTDLLPSERLINYKHHTPPAGEGSIVYRYPLWFFSCERLLRCLSKGCLDTRITLLWLVVVEAVPNFCLAKKYFLAEHGGALEVPKDK